MNTTATARRVRIASHVGSIETDERSMDMEIPLKSAITHVVRPDDLAGPIVQTLSAQLGAPLPRSACFEVPFCHRQADALKQEAVLLAL